MSWRFRRARAGHEGSLAIELLYGGDGQRRQRWNRLPSTGQAHRFAEVLSCRVAGGQEHFCLVRATSSEPWEGQSALRLYGFTARDVATALAMVGA